MLDHPLTRAIRIGATQGVVIGTVLGVALALILLCLPAHSQMLQSLAGSSMGCVPSTQAAAFLARTSGLDPKHRTQMCIYINGLVTKGVFAKLDVLYIFATNTSANALLNLVQNNFNGTANGSPTFTADAGFTGTDASTTIFIDTGFNPTTASAPNYTQNAAHMSAWSNTNAQASASGGVLIGFADINANTMISEVFAKYSDGNEYFRINDNGTTPSAGIANANATGHYLANRSGASAQQGYKNAVDQGVTAVSSTTLQNENIYVLASDRSTAAIGSGLQIMMASIGGNLSSTNVTDFYNLTHAYLQVIGGVP